MWSWLSTFKNFLKFQTRTNELGDIRIRVITFFDKKMISGRFLRKALNLKGSSQDHTNSWPCGRSSPNTFPHHCRPFLALSHRLFHVSFRGQSQSGHTSLIPIENHDAIEWSECPGYRNPRGSYQISRNAAGGAEKPVRTPRPGRRTCISDIDLRSYLFFFN